MNNNDTKKACDFPESHREAFSCGYLWGQESIVNTLVQDEKAKYDHVLGLLRDSKMKHGICEPVKRRACTACAAQRQLDKLEKEWKGFTVTAT